MALVNVHNAAGQQITIAPLAGSLGAEIGGVDLAADLDADTVTAIRHAWLEHQVLFFRDQELSTPMILWRSHVGSVNPPSIRSCRASRDTPRSSR